MADYIPAKESQLIFYKETRLFCKSSDDDFILYKKSGETLDQKHLDEVKRPDLYIHKNDKKTAVKELFSTLNKRLAQLSMEKDLNAVRSTLYLIVKEALDKPDDGGIDSFPETIEILFNGFSNRSELLETIVKLKDTSDLIIDHTINVLLITLRYCFYHNFEEKEIKRLALCAILHDIGASMLEQRLVQAEPRLTDEEFKDYQMHTRKGHDLLKSHTQIDPSAARVALEHHERINGSGYPKGETNPCFDSQLIGLIDSYEPLTYRDKSYRKAKQPFESLQQIKTEVIDGRFKTDLFKNLCSCLTG